MIAGAYQPFVWVRHQVQCPHMPLTEHGSKGSGNQVCAAMSAKSLSTALLEISYILLKNR